MTNEKKASGSKKRISMISAMHYFKLVFRSALFLWAVMTYFTDPTLHNMHFTELVPRYYVLVIFVWIVFAVEMALRFFPSPFEGMGCEKQFKSRFIQAGPDVSKAKPDTAKTTFLSALSWILLNGGIAALYYTGVIDDGYLLMTALFFSVSDMICILFFCPFQTLIMKNRCCATCRIYNWDYLMMFTPLIFARSLFTWSLAGMALILLIRWEVTVRLHPERFMEKYNAGLKCANCTEKLCSHKKQLHLFWRVQRERLQRLEDYVQEHMPDHIPEHIQQQLHRHFPAAHRRHASDAMKKH